MEVEKTLKKKETVVLLKEITKALESGKARAINVADLTIKLPKKIEFSLEYEVGDEKTELEVEFGDNVAKLVDGVTKMGQIQEYRGQSKRSRKERARRKPA